MVKQLIKANIILLLSSRIVRTFILQFGFISFDVGQIIVDNGDIAQTRTQI